MRKKIDVHIIIPTETYEALRAIAKKQYRKISAVINMALDNFLKKVDAKNGKSKQ